MSEAVFIHYGSKKFDITKFEDIKNQPFFVKPTGGLWGSPVNSEFGWKHWCEGSNFSECNEDNSFQFILDETANILEINSVKDLDNLPRVKSPIPGLKINSVVCLDYERILASGVDAIVLNMSKNTDRIGDSLYFALYGWDCDSILVMNKNIVKQCS